MSSLIIRNTIKSELQLNFSYIQFYNTLAYALDRENLPDIWQTIEFTNSSNTPISIGKNACWREISLVNIYVVVETGAGEDQAIVELGNIANHFRYFNDNSGLRVATVGSPETSDQSDGRWLICTLSLEVNYDYFP